MQSFLIEIQGPGNSFPRSLSQLHKSLLHINQFHSPFFLVMRLVLALHFFRALLRRKESTMLYLMMLMSLFPLLVLRDIMLLEGAKDSDK